MWHTEHLALEPASSFPLVHTLGGNDAGPDKWNLVTYSHRRLRLNPSSRLGTNPILSTVGNWEVNQQTNGSVVYLFDSKKETYAREDVISEQMANLAILQHLYAEAKERSSSPGCRRESRGVSNSPSLGAREAQD